MCDKPLVETATTHEFLELAAARKPTPGGGGIAALSGALAAAMAEMTLNFTVGNRKYAEVQKDCLLYTSPSPRDRTRSRMPSSA